MLNLISHVGFEAHLLSTPMQVDVAILEVGLGGKFDATNVVCIIYI
jgi:folylpolyglutamate synthase/dihydropteroate synthase